MIITGAGNGIGLATVKFLAESRKHCILAVSRNTVRLRNLRNPKVIPCSADLSLPGSATEIAREAENRLAYVDILIHNAGQLVNKAFTDQTEEDYHTQFDVNVKAVFLLTREIIPLMRPGSHILMISSMGGYQGSQKYPGLSLYSASKAAICSLTECLAAELGPYGIRANCLALGAVDTPMLKKAFPGYQAPVSAAKMGQYIADFALRGSEYHQGKIIPVSTSNP